MTTPRVRRCVIAPVSPLVWQVRGALLSIERDASSITDLQEVFVLYDTNNDGELNKEEVDELLKSLPRD